MKHEGKELSTPDYWALTVIPSEGRTEGRMVAREACSDYATAEQVIHSMFNAVLQLLQAPLYRYVSFLGNNQKTMNRAFDLSLCFYLFLHIE